MAFDCKVLVPEAEVAGFEIKTSRKDGAEYAVVRFLDERGIMSEAIDRDTERIKTYKRRQILDLTLLVKEGGGRERSWVNVSVENAVPSANV